MLRVLFFVAALAVATAKSQNAQISTAGGQVAFKDKEDSEFTVLSNKLGNIDGNINAVTKKVDDNKIELQSGIDAVAKKVSDNKIEHQGNIDAVTKEVSDNKVELQGNIDSNINAVTKKVNDNKLELQSGIDAVAKKVNDNKLELQSGIDVVSKKVNDNKLELQSDIDSKISTVTKKAADNKLQLQSGIDSINSKIGSPVGSDSISTQINDINVALKNQGEKLEEEDAAIVNLYDTLKANTNIQFTQTTEDLTKKLKESEDSLTEKSQELNSAIGANARAISEAKTELRGADAAIRADLSEAKSNLENAVGDNERALSEAKTELKNADDANARALSEAKTELENADDANARALSEAKTDVDNTFKEIEGHFKAVENAFLGLNDTFEAIENGFISQEEAFNDAKTELENADEVVTARARKDATDLANLIKEVSDGQTAVMNSMVDKLSDIKSCGGGGAAQANIKAMILGVKDEDSSTLRAPGEPQDVFVFGVGRTFKADDGVYSCSLFLEDGSQISGTALSKSRISNDKIQCSFKSIPKKNVISATFDAKIVVNELGKALENVHATAPKLSFKVIGPVISSNDLEKILFKDLLGDSAGEYGVGFKVTDTDTVDEDVKLTATISNVNNQQLANFIKQTSFVGTPDGSSRVLDLIFDTSGAMEDLVKEYGFTCSLKITASDNHGYKTEKTIKINVRAALKQCGPDSDGVTELQKSDGTSYNAFCLGANKLKDFGTKHSGPGPSTGGWTLLGTRVSGSTWWDNWGKLTNADTRGSVSNAIANPRTSEYKSISWEDLKVNSLLFYGEASGKSFWATYDNVGRRDSSKQNGWGEADTLAGIIDSFNPGKTTGQGGGNANHCWGASSNSNNKCPSNTKWNKCTLGFLKSEGTLTKTGRMCSTDLFFNTGDKDGGDDKCGSYDNEGLGPCFSGYNNNGCPLDDPGGFTCWSNPGGRGHNLLFMTPATGSGYSPDKYNGKNEGFVAVFGRLK